MDLVTNTKLRLKCKIGAGWAANVIAFRSACHVQTTRHTWNVSRILCIFPPWSPILRTFVIPSTRRHQKKNVSPFLPRERNRFAVVRLHPSSSDYFWLWHFSCYCFSLRLCLLAAFNPCPLTSSLTHHSPSLLRWILFHSILTWVIQLLWRFFYHPILTLSRRAPVVKGIDFPGEMSHNPL